MKLKYKALSQAKLPILLIWGDRDYFFPMDIATELYTSLPDARFWVIPAQGHTPLWTFMGGDENANHTLDAS